MLPLKTGAAYHGNRMLHHVEEDMRDMAEHHMNLVVHMFSHNDWMRHRNVMKDVVSISQEAGLEVWMDNWGLGGPPGEISYFLALHPEAHQIYSDGSVDPKRACMNAPSFRQFLHEWIDAVQETGATTIFWDEPHLPMKGTAYACACPVCRNSCDFSRILSGSFRISIFFYIIGSSRSVRSISGFRGQAFITRSSDRNRRTDIS